MAFEREYFCISGPLKPTAIHWRNVHHRRSIAACLVKGVYVAERDRQQQRQGSQALAPPWWESFQFKLLCHLKDDADFSIFGAIYEFKPPLSHSELSTDAIPRFVIAFRGTLLQPESLYRDFELDLSLFRNKLHWKSRVEIALRAVTNKVASVGNSNVCLAGHSLGSAVAMLAGITMARTGDFLEAFLFNPPFISAPIERIKNKKVKHGIRIVRSMIKAGLALATEKNYNNKNSGSQDPFLALSEWLPCLFVNSADYICSEYIGYFKHRKIMEGIGAGAVERVATRHSLRHLIMKIVGKGSDSDPLHLIPSANLTVHSTTSQDLGEAHGIHQWWKHDLNLQSQVHKYK